MVARTRKAFFITQQGSHSTKLAIALSLRAGGKWFLSLVAGFIILSLQGCSSEHYIGILNPKGVISFHERKLLFDTLALMLIVVIPVIIMSFTFVYHYQVSHRIRDYKPNWAHSYFLETIWWLIPCAIIFILGVITWKTTHELDPFRRITGHQEEQPMLIQAIALPWKWLFIYPQENIATVNYLVMPVNQQVEYWITADNAPMSAFFIPQLGSQIYAMAGMRTRLHLVANVPGVYDGLNSQYNGDGFAEMHFNVNVVAKEQMQTLIAEIKKTPNKLTDAAYQQLLQPSINDKPQFFSSVTPGLFDKSIMVYMHTFGVNHPRQVFNYNPVHENKE